MQKAPQEATTRGLLRGPSKGEKMLRIIMAFLLLAIKAIDTSSKCKILGTRIIEICVIVVS